MLYFARVLRYKTGTHNEVSMNKRYSILFLSLIILASCMACGRSTLFQSAQKNTIDYPVSEKSLHLISFFINKSFSWYGEVDRFHGRFYTIDPAAEYFGKQCLARINVFFDPRRDYTTMAKEHDVKTPQLGDYTIASKTVLFENISDYEPLLQKIAAQGDHFIVIENMFEVILKHADNRSSLLTINMHILNHRAERVFSKTYEHRYDFSEEDYNVLISFSNYNRNEIQKRIMQIFFENFIHLAPEVIADLASIVHS